MKIVIAGGTGQLGGLLVKGLSAAGHDPVVLSRRAGFGGACRHLPWDGRTLGPWQDEVDGADAVINLAGRSVDCRYHAVNRRAILMSRLESTKVLGEAIAAARQPPTIWLQASTATIYNHSYDVAQDEITGEVGGLPPRAPDSWRFSTDVAVRWEAACNTVTTPHTRKVLMRIAIVVSTWQRGAFEILRGLARRGLGGAIGDGRQYVSWIHEQDFVRAVIWLLEHPEISGPVNLAAPHPLPNREFMAILRRAVGRGFGLPAPGWLMEVAAFFLRTESELVLKSRRVVPRRLLEAGFRFQYSGWADAAEELCRRSAARGAIRTTSALVSEAR